jgi:hypothetical protein
MLFFTAYVEFPGLCSNAIHQVKAIAIGTVKDNPAAEIISVFLFSLHYTYGIYISANCIKRGMHPYSASLYCIQFSFGIVVTGILSHLNTR